MPLVASCDGVYFPPEPRENVITLVWKNGGAEDANAKASASPDAAAAPNTTLIFKVKSTAPQLFHVRPHFGALLLVDPSALPTPASFQSTTVTFGLRSQQGAGDDGTAEAGHIGTPRKSASGRYQERFVVDYAVLTNESLAYQQVAQAVRDPAKLTEVVKSVWSLISSGAVNASHVSLRGHVNLKAYLDGVVLNGKAVSKEEAASVVVVPATAKLVPVSNDRASASTRRSAGSAAGATSASADTTTGGSTATPRKAEELRALREEVSTLRRGSNAGSSSSASATVRPGEPASSAGSRNVANVSRNLLRSNTSNLSGEEDDGDDILMKMPLSAAKTAADGKPKKKKGLKLYLLLLIMFTVYFACLYLRRGGRAPAKRTALASPKGNSSVVVQSDGKAAGAASGDL